ncbi:MAG TPA: TetR/AcrR family transcriptional regulator [Bacteroidales bacterium]|nr:TetR/AcrR family transcriptional regulator [Bacteroidales bacterium]
MSVKDNKAKLIIETAQRRFGLFGVEKTSMREIADDLKLSKASLYYYFPDKESLYKAVVEKEQEEFIFKISECITMVEDPDSLLKEYANSRLSFFTSLLNLTRLRLESYSDLKPVFRETLNKFRNKEKEIVLRILKKGIDSGLFSIDDPEMTASLFLTILKGLRIAVINDKLGMLIEERELEGLRFDTMAFTDIFIKGLKAKY